MPAMNSSLQEKDAELQQLKTDCLSYARRLDYFATSSLSRHGVPQDDDYRIVLFTYAVRMSRYFQAVCKLVECGLNDAAGTSLRCLLEQSFVFCSMSGDPRLLQRLARESSAEGRKALNGLLKLQPGNRAAELTDELIHAELSGMLEGSGFNVFDWAKQCGQTDTYHTMYRRLNTYAHGSMSAIEEYLEKDALQTILRVRPNVAHSWAPDFLTAASSILLNAVSVVVSNGGTEALPPNAILLEAELESLRQRTYAVHDVTPALDCPAHAGPKGER